VQGETVHCHCEWASGPGGMVVSRSDSSLNTKYSVLTTQHKVVRFTHDTPVFSPLARIHPPPEAEDSTKST
jgi:hypothetical protein